MFVLIGASLFNITVGAIHESPLLEVSISSAIACDEFHGDNNCTCQESVFNPCCPWWKDKSEWDASCFPDGKVPPKPAIRQAKKDAARKLQFYYAGNVAFLTSLGIGAGVVAGPIGAAGPGIGAAVATYKAWSWGTVVSDPWDENFQQPYDGGAWPSPEELGLWYTNYDSLNNLVWTAQTLVFYADFVYVSANRATSCEMAGVDCFGWQVDRVNWGLSQMGNVLAISRDNHEWAAWQAEYEGADPELARKLREIAEWDNWGAGEFQ
jgi:hypothetical protein